jgi:uncharacterized protein involved in tolerance to divalent cations
MDIKYEMFRPQYHEKGKIIFLKENAVFIKRKRSRQEEEEGIKSLMYLLCDVRSCVRLLKENSQYLWSRKIELGRLIIVFASHLFHLSAIILGNNYNDVNLSLNYYHDYYHVKVVRIDFLSVL